VSHGPAFGQADLTNCERELIHLAGSIQPHGLLLVLREPDLTVLQASANGDALLGVRVTDLLERSVTRLGGDLADRLRPLVAIPDLTDPVPLQCHVDAGAGRCAFEGTAHRLPGGPLLVELEPADTTGGRVPVVTLEQPVLMALVQAAVQRFSSASSIEVLADATAAVFREMTGYDRVMVYRFDPDGHGQIVAESRDPRLESLLGHRYPSTDIPQRARELYIRNRVRVLVDVHYEPVALVPRVLPPSGQELDMSMCYLRSMSPLHLQYLRNMGVTATLVVSLVREGRLWGLVAAHHYSPRNLRFELRAAADLLAEVITTRLAAIENYAYAQVAISVRRLEQRLVEATATEGDWRYALLRTPRTLLQPLGATGAALFHDEEILTCGEVPSTPELRALCRWVDDRAADGPFGSSSLARENPAFSSLTPVASGVLVVRLSASRPDFLMWFRREQLMSVTWAGDPAKAVVGNDPLELSPRRSFSAWTEIVRGTALPWSGAELVLSRAIGAALVEIIVQVNAVRLLIAEHQLSGVRATVRSAQEPVLVADAAGQVLLCNDAFRTLVGERADRLRSLRDVAELFEPAEPMRLRLDSLRVDHQPWRGELSISRDGGVLPVGCRAEVVPGRDASVLGFMLVLADLRDSKRAAQARRQLEEALSFAAVERSGPDLMPREPDAVIGAILNNASLAAMDMADAAGGAAVAPMLADLEQSARRAALLYARMRTFADAR
jgi:chemotaxis family two-component system sensor kinase Cph1